MSDSFEKLIDLISQQSGVDRDVVKKSIESRLADRISPLVESAIAEFIEYLELPQSIASLSEQEEV